MTAKTPDSYSGATIFKALENGHPTGFRSAITLQAPVVDDGKAQCAWLIDNCHGRFATTTKVTLTPPDRSTAMRSAAMVWTMMLVVEFENRNDAMLFKLTWGGSV
jgi:hypothetical protein